MAEAAKTAGVPAAESTRLARATASLLWSAWADALGFISELANESSLRTRTKGKPLTDAIGWTRRVGGKFGVQVDLPAGCYSDDTQLRLATSRAISDHGFDVEAFARVELTVWPSYALGGGRASKAAAANMAKSNVTWFTNFYSGWAEAGGNGAAMRIQPHVWAAKDLTRLGFLDDVIRNAIVTHGHPRALVGAVVHALCLAFALEKGRVPEVEDWGGILRGTAMAVKAFSQDGELGTYWRPRWEADTGKDFESEWHATVQECVALLRRIEPLIGEVAEFSEPAEVVRATGAYRALGDMLGLREASTRGSATATVIASMALAAAFATDPYNAALLAAGALGTDTDTIATMAAAVIGAATGIPAPDAIQDRVYLSNEADRLTRISAGRSAPKFSYPDILRWTPPRSQLDVVGVAEGRPALAGLGWLTWKSEHHPSSDAQWTWAQTSFGPTVLIKHRFDLADLPAANWPRLRSGSTSAQAPASPVRNVVLRAVENSVQTPLFESDPAQGSTRIEMGAAPPRPVSSDKGAHQSTIDLDRIFATLSQDGFTDEGVGRAVTRVALEGTLEQLATLIAQLRPELRARRLKP